MLHLLAHNLCLTVITLRSVVRYFRLFYKPCNQLRSKSFLSELRSYFRGDDFFIALIECKIDIVKSRSSFIAEKVR